QRGEMAFDGVEVAGVGWRRDQLDLVRGREGADVLGPVGGQVVLNPVDALPARVGEPDLAHEAEHVAAGPPRAQPDSEPVGVDVVGAEDVAGTGAAGFVGAAPPPAPPLAPLPPRGA